MSVCACVGGVYVHALGTHWSASLAKLMSFRFIRRPCLNEVENDRGRQSLSNSRVHRYTQPHAKIHHTHKNMEKFLLLWWMLFN